MDSSDSFKRDISFLNISEEEKAFRISCVDYLIQKYSIWKDSDFFFKFKDTYLFREIFREFSLSTYRNVIDNIFIHPFFKNRISIQNIIENFCELANFNYSVREEKLLDLKDKEIIDFLSKLSNIQFSYILKQIKNICGEYDSFYANYFSERWKDNFPLELLRFKYLVDGLNNEKNLS